VIACNPDNLPLAVQTNFVKGLMNASQDPKGQRLLTICRITGFEDVSKDYDKELAEIIKAFPPPSGK
jgi:hypothetical protein